MLPTLGGVAGDSRKRRNIGNPPDAGKSECGVRVQLRGCL